MCSINAIIHACDAVLHNYVYETYLILSKNLLVGTSGEQLKRKPSIRSIEAGPGDWEFSILSTKPLTNICFPILPYLLPVIADILSNLTLTEYLNFVPSEPPWGSAESISLSGEEPRRWTSNFLLESRLKECNQKLLITLARE